MNQSLFRAFVLGLLLALSACPSMERSRERQTYEYDEVVARAEQLEVGMTHTQVLLLLGHPADKSIDDNIWVYMPPRPALLVPSEALRVEFRIGKLVGYVFRPIVLGEDL